MDTHSFYIEAIDLRAHPIKKATKKLPKWLPEHTRHL